ncbi:hypothetical protein KAT80_03845 [Candidatus Pacearchaeota archaeon]|nr:hypothetical protein [Candidatus Pacearchaeota archaeon]
MLGRNTRPDLSLELSAEAKIKEEQDKLIDLSDKELIGLAKSVKGNWRKWKGDIACSWMNIDFQPEEVYKGLGAGRILTQRYGKEYVKKNVLDY